MIRNRRPFHMRLLNGSAIRVFLTILAIQAIAAQLLSAEPVVEKSPAGKAKVAAPGKDRQGKARSENFRKFAKALEALGEHYDSSVSLAPNSEAAGAAGRLCFQLQALPADERYELLRDWTLPADGRDSIRLYIVVIPDAPPPAVFLTEKLPEFDDPVISTATLLIEAARDSGRLAEFSALVERLVDFRVQGAETLKRLVDRVRAHNGPNRTSILQVLDKHELEQQLQTAKQSANFSLILWFYRAKALAEIERTKGATLKPSTDPGLKHWVPVDLRTAASGNQFGSPSWWVALDDRIGHVCSPWVDHLLFAYPLTGEFEISCEPFNDFWSEANVSFGGLMVEAWNQGSRMNQVYPPNAHEIVVTPAPAGPLGQFQKMKVRVEPGRLKVLANDKLLFEEPSLSPTSPFLVLRTTWLSAFRNLRVEGKPVIPRQIALVSGRRMEGWVSSFYGESQPPELTVRHKQPNGGSVAAPSDDPDAFDWSAAEGTLRGRRFADLAAPARQTGFQHGESWLYYHRPLRDGERIQYEYLYKPGEDAVDVHPTLDRLAFLLRPDGVRLHWLTTNRTQGFTPDSGWIATDNEVDDLVGHRGPATLPLKPNEWNAAAVEVSAGKVRVELNGQLVYERPVAPSWGTRFGFYHDRTRSAVRIRNVVLSGDWPEWAEQLAGKLLERRQPLPAADQAAIRAILTPRLTATDSP